MVVFVELVEEISADYRLNYSLRFGARDSPVRVCPIACKYTCYRSLRFRSMSSVRDMDGRVCRLKAQEETILRRCRKEHSVRWYAPLTCPSLVLSLVHHAVNYGPGLVPMPVSHINL